jgi:hypothetical protein
MSEALTAGLVVFSWIVGLGAGLVCCGVLGVLGLKFVDWMAR